MSNSTIRRTGSFALVAGFIGVLAVGLLIAALMAPTPAPSSMRRATDLFAWQNAAVVLQALTMMPVTLGLYRWHSNYRYVALWLGLIGQVTLALTAGLLLTGSVSDMLYMAPMGIVGVWLLIINKRDDDLYSRALSWTGKVAGIGLVLVGIGFVIYGVFVAPAVFVRPLTNAELDAQSLTTPNLLAHLSMAAGTLLGRVVYPIWTIAIGVRMSRLGRD